MTSNTVQKYDCVDLGRMLTSLYGRECNRSPTFLDVILWQQAKFSGVKHRKRLIFSIVQVRTRKDSVTGMVTSVNYRLSEFMTHDHVQVFYDCIIITNFYFCILRIRL